MKLRHFRFAPVIKDVFFVSVMNDFNVNINGVKKKKTSYGQMLN